MKQQIPNNAIRQVLLLSFILLLGVVLFGELRSFIPAFLGSYTLYAIMRKYMFLLESKYKMRSSLAAALLMFLSFIVILLPIFLLVNMLTSKVAFAIKHMNEVLLAIKDFIRQYEVQYRIEILTAENINKLTNWGAQTLPQILGATLSTVVALVVMYFILFFMLTQGRWMESKFYEWAPLKDENLLLLRKDLNKMVLSNAIGIPLIAFLQGVVALIGYLIIGVPQPIFWFAITAFTALLPVVGAALAYIPLSLLLFADGDNVRGFIVLGFGLGVIGSVDNIFRFWLAKKLGDVHPLITVFGVIIGVNMFGFIGIIFGPILISLFLIMIRIYANEFGMQRNSTTQR
ncbi:MAG: AI-2E family transporter [Chitinophagaceae bacterium]|nr:AI-2E family transporter [Chitinophagaceae bacterium]